MPRCVETLNCARSSLIWTGNLDLYQYLTSQARQAGITPSRDPSASRPPCIRTFVTWLTAYPQIRKQPQVAKMGSSASKATSSTARRLPTSTQSSLPKLPPNRQAPPPLSGRQVNSNDTELDETYSRHRDLRGNAPQRPSPLNAAAEAEGAGGLGKKGKEAGRSAALDYGLADQGARPGTTGKAKAGFTGEKDDGECS